MKVVLPKYASLVAVILIILLYESVTVHAQPVITTAGCMPVIGDKFNVQYAILSSVNKPDTGGANCIWDYSKLLDSSRNETVSVIPANSAAIILPQSDLYPSIWNENAVFFHKSVDTIYDYCRIDTNSIQDMERFGKVPLLPFNNWYGVHFTPLFLSNTTLRQMFYPMTYQTKNNSICQAYKLPLCTCTDVNYFQIYDTIVADGYGTLQLPKATYNNVLRIKVKFNVEYHQFLGSTPMPLVYSTYTTYKYYVDSIHYPVLEIKGSTFAGNWVADYLTGHSFDTIMPVAFSDIKVTAINNVVQVNWQTATETNTDHFMIQHSTDGNAFTDIGKVKAIGSGANNYSFTDNNPAIGTNYYRIQSIDKNGSSSYSKMVLITNYELGITVYPNPAKSTVTIGGNHIASIQITYNMGRMVNSIMLQDATNPKIAIGSLPAGEYHLRVQTMDGKVSGGQLIIDN